MWNRRRKDIFEDIFKDMDDMIRRMFESRIDNEEMGEPLVWGYSMTQRGNEPPEIREFGNLSLRDEMFSRPWSEHQFGAAHVEPGMRKPLVDIIEAEDSLHVVVEMPGITREDVSLEISGTVLNIKARNENRKYSERVELPARVLEDSAKATYKNGVLEVVFKYDRSDKKSIKVD
jgi:HSP20 family protein